MRRDSANALCSVSGHFRITQAMFFAILLVLDRGRLRRERNEHEKGESPGGGAYLVALMSFIDLLGFGYSQYMFDLKTLLTSSLVLCTG